MLFITDWGYYYIERLPPYRDITDTAEKNPPIIFIGGFLTESVSYHVQIGRDIK